MAQLVLTLVEPQSSGIGGGALMLHFNGQSIQAYDGRETAPRSADTDLWLRNREPIAFQEAVIGGRSVGTPGVLRLLELAHRHHGRLAWQALFAPAIRLAENGFEISPRLNALLQRDPGLRSDPRARAFFTPNPDTHTPWERAYGIKSLRSCLEKSRNRVPTCFIGEL